MITKINSINISFEIKYNLHYLTVTRVLTISEKYLMPRKGRGRSQAHVKDHEFLFIVP